MNKGYSQIAVSDLSYKIYFILELRKHFINNYEKQGMFFMVSNWLNLKKLLLMLTSCPLTIHWKKVVSRNIFHFEKKNWEIYFPMPFSSVWVFIEHNNELNFGIKCLNRCLTVLLPICLNIKQRNYGGFINTFW